MKSKTPKAKDKKAAPQMPFRGYWDDEEEQALRDAVQKHGIGAWEKMRHDPDFKVLKCVPRARTEARASRVSPAPTPTRAKNRAVARPRDPRISGSNRSTRRPPDERRNCRRRVSRRVGRARPRRRVSRLLASPARVEPALIPPPHPRNPPPLVAGVERACNSRTNGEI